MDKQFNDLLIISEVTKTRKLYRGISISKMIFWENEIVIDVDVKEGSIDERIIVYKTNDLKITIE